MRLHALHCGGDVMDWAAFDPFDPNVGTRVYNPYFFYVLEHPEGRLLFDSGVHPELRTDPEKRLGSAAADFQVQLEPEHHIESRLAAIGLKPRDIDIVVQSHLHFDHAGGLGLADARPDPGPARRARLRHGSARLPGGDLPARRLRDGPGVAAVGRRRRRLRRRTRDGDLHARPHTRAPIGCSSIWTARRSSCSPTLPTSSARCGRAVPPGVIWSPDAMIASWDRVPSRRSSAARTRI